MSKKHYNVAVIGCGEIADFHLNAVLNKAETSLYAVCDSATDGRLESRQEKYGAEIAVTDYRELVDDPKVDLVVICTPDKTHLEMTAAFLRAGKAVLLEKPMALTNEECSEIRKVEKETGGMLMVGQVARYNPNFVKAKKLVDEGAIGDLVFVESEYAHNYGTHPGYDSWRICPEREGMIGGGCHAVDFLRWVAGNPTEVHAFATHKYLTDWPVNDTTIAIYKFPNDVVGKVFCSIGVKRDYTMRTCLYGTTGTIIFESKGTEMKLYQCNEEGKGYGKAQLLPCQPKGHNMDAELSDFVDALLAGEPAPISSIEGASTVAVCRATVESAATGETVKIVYPEQ